MENYIHSKQIGLSIRRGHRSNATETTNEIVQTQIRRPWNDWENSVDQDQTPQNDWGNSVDTDQTRQNVSANCRAPDQMPQND